MLSTKKIVRSGLISALYVVLSLIAFPIASGQIQFRPSEALTLLPLLYVESIPALFIGCFLSDLILGCTIYDTVFGSLITLISAVLTCVFGKAIKKKPFKILVGGSFPVLLNAFLLPVIWYLTLGASKFIYIVQCLFLLAGESVSIYLLGSYLYVFIDRSREKISFLQ